MTKFILTNDDFSSIEDIGKKLFIKDIVCGSIEGSPITKQQLIISVYRCLTEDEVESIISNKNRFILINDNDEINYCLESKNKMYYKHSGISYDIYLEDVNEIEIDKGLVNMLKFTLC